MDNKLKICVTVGHSRLKNGAYTSADGRYYGGVLEYKYCRDFAKKYLVPTLKKVGHDVTLIICPEKQFTDAMTALLRFLLKLIRSQMYLTRL